MKETEEQKKQRRAEHNTRLLHNLPSPVKTTKPMAPPMTPPPAPQQTVSWASIMEKITLDNRDRINRLEGRIIVLSAVIAASFIVTLATILGSLK